MPLNLLRIARHLSATITFLSLGCDVALDASNGTDLDSVSVLCTEQDDCPDGFICEQSRGQCLSSNSDTGGVSNIIIEISPQSDETVTSTMTTVIGPVALGTSVVQDVTLQASSDVFGTVFNPVAELDLRGDVTFTPTLDTTLDPSLQVAVSASLSAAAAQGSISADPVSARDEQDADYGVNLLAGGTYDVLFEPLGSAAEQLPPYRSQITIAENVPFQRVDLIYPSKFTDYDGIITNENGDPVNGLRVLAVQGTTVVSSTATTGTGAEPGTFALKVDPFATQFDLRITSGSETTPFPTVITGAPSNSNSQGFHEIEVTTYEFVTYSGRVQDPDGTGVEKANISFISDAINPVGTFQATTSTSSDGAFTVSLIPGSYTVVTSASTADASLGVNFQNRTVLSAIADEVIVLPNRSTVNGLVTTSTGQPVSEAELQALAVTNTASGNLSTTFNRSSEIESDADGLFSLPVDIGSYDIVAQPPAGSSLPWLVQLNQSFQTTGTQFTQDLVFPAAAELTGTVTVTTPEGTVPAANAGIRVRAIVQDGTDVRTVTIAEGQTEEDGTYSVVLPAL